MTVLIFYRKQEKEIGINFVLFSQSRNMIGRFMKTFSHQREKSKIFSISSKYFSIFNNILPASNITHMTRKFLACYSCSYYSFRLKVLTCMQLSTRLRITVKYYQNDIIAVTTYKCYIFFHWNF